MNKKATWAWADALYWFFYIPLTLVVIVALIVVPTSVLNSSVQPTALDAKIMNERIINNLATYSSSQGIKWEFVQEPQKRLSYSTSKKFGAKIEFDGKTYHINKQNYDDYIPLARIGYFHSRYLGPFGQSTNTIFIEQVYPSRYEQ